MQDRVDQRRAAVLLGLPESELRGYAQASGLGHIENDEEGQKVVFTYEELRRICTRPGSGRLPPQTPGALPSNELHCSVVASLKTPSLEREGKPRKGTTAFDSEPAKRVKNPLFQAKPISL